MIYRILIFSVIILALIYYVSIVLQLFSDGRVMVTKSKIRLFKAMIPFYYWVSGTEDSGEDGDDERSELFRESDGNGNSLIQK